MEPDLEAFLRIRRRDKAIDEEKRAVRALGGVFRAIDVLTVQEYLTRNNIRVKGTICGTEFGPESIEERYLSLTGDLRLVDLLSWAGYCMNDGLPPIRFSSLRDRIKNKMIPSKPGNLSEEESTIWAQYSFQAEEDWKRICKHLWRNAAHQEFLDIYGLRVKGESPRRKSSYIHIPPQISANLGLKIEDYTTTEKSKYKNMNGASRLAQIDAIKFMFQ